jgi:hypothetical protein
VVSCDLSYEYLVNIMMKAGLTDACTRRMSDDMDCHDVTWDDVKHDSCHYFLQPVAGK